MRLPRKWLLGMAVMAALPHAGWAQTSPQNLSEQTASPAAEQPAARKNTDVARDIATALKGAGLTGRNVKIQVQNGTAVLQGEIGSPEQYQTVSRLAASVPGVTSVQNQMVPMTAEPAPAASPAVQTAAYEAPSAPAAGAVRPVSGEVVVPPAPAARSNTAVAQEIARGLSGVGLNKYDIEVRFKNGVCSLIGAVKQPGEAAQAQWITQQVAGVETVVNKLTVNGVPADSLIGSDGRGTGQPIRQVAGEYQPMRANFAPQYGQVAYPQGGPQMMPPRPMPQGIQQTAAQYGPAPGGMAPAGPGYGGQVQPVGHHGPAVYNRPTLPDHAWPAYAAYDNYAAVTYPSQYDASAFPYIGPFYPYPQVPLGWREAELSWDDGYWNLEFNSRTDKWWWFLNPQNWH